MLNLLKNSNRTERILVTLKALNTADYQVNMVDEEPEYILIKDDVKLNDATEVIKYLCASSELYGTLDEANKALADEWVLFCKNELEVPISVLTWLATGLIAREDVPVLSEKKARSDCMMLLRKIELRLKESTYLAGETLSIADIIVASCLRPLFMHVFGEVERKNNQKMCAWIQSLYSSTMFVDALGETTLLVSSKKDKKKN